MSSLAGEERGEDIAGNHGCEHGDGKEAEGTQQRRANLLEEIVTEQLIDGVQRIHDAQIHAPFGFWQEGVRIGFLPSIASG